MRPCTLPVLFGVLLLAGLGCVTEPDEGGGFSSFNQTLSTAATFTTTNTDAETDEGDGDGDSGDGDGDGDGDSGDGDGDGDSGDGDGDGDPGDGDGDPDCDWIPNPEQNPTADCDPILQDCPVGEKCVGFGISGAWDNNKCVPVTGNQAPGQACSVDSIASSMDNCDAQGQCFNLDGDNNGVCLAFCGCTYEMPVCAAGTTCLVANDGSLALCVASCDPLLQDCPIGEGCYSSNGGLICAPEGSIPVGESCGFINDCAPGNGCFNVPACGAACCSPFCEVGGDDSECAVLPGTTCMQVETWGVCG